MEEETTTEATVVQGGETIQGIAVDANGSAIPEPEASEEAEAVVTTTEPEQQPIATVEESAGEGNEPSEEDEQLAKFASAKGLELDSENARKAAKMAMNAEKLMHSKGQKASELERTMSTMSDVSAEQVAEATGQNPEVLKRLQRMEVKDSIREFWDTHPGARELETEMAQIAVNSGLYGAPEAILEASYAIALGKKTDAVKSQVKKETLQNLAHKQTAAVPRGNAVNAVTASEAITPQNVDALVASHDLNWFRAHQAEINKAMAG